ncbi:uncharacterized protein LOC114544072 [Dendronephthya gigantea]|uniref:uncharacterized protein LOC114517167 n=1 Tax=Dendronephthya gigantea TaxID=151771 RepID=UPI0010693524|nr:uncharacterized protein LOC114517167 [Dendronephthya gigantea]XP_028418618.1 uncharacterized protein LOC114544072 [Dendronephthya gigantea]
MYSLVLWLETLGLIFVATAIACEEGKYKSDFLSGCAECPKTLKQCNDEQIDDARRCVLACGKLFTTKAPITSPTIPVLVTKPTTTPRPITKWVTKRWTITEFEKFKKTLEFSTPTVLSVISTGKGNYNNNNGNSIGVISAILIAVLIICVLIGILLRFIWRLYQKNKRSGQQQERPPSPCYSAVQQSNSSIEDDIQEDAIPEDSVSRENFNNLTETTL